MSYKEAVKRKIAGEANEIARRKELWRKIYNAYEQGGEEAIKPALIEEGDSVTSEFDELLKQLREKL